MANTFTQIYVQIVFAVQGRNNLVRESFRDEPLGQVRTQIKVSARNPLNFHLCSNPVSGATDIVLHQWHLHFAV